MDKNLTLPFLAHTGIGTVPVLNQDADFCPDLKLGRSSPQIGTVPISGTLFQN